MSIDPQALYVQLGRLLEAMPNLGLGLPLRSEEQEWVGRAGALIDASEDRMDIAEFRTQSAALTMSTMQESAAQQIGIIVRRALYKAELRAPRQSQGAFIAAGNAFDALAAVAKVLTTAKNDVLIVDPYMDEKTLTDFAPLARERVAIRLLADQDSAKATLRPAVIRWIAQYGVNRPLTAKLAAPRALHDRLILTDNSSAWILTQSLNAIAQRSPASIVRVDDETAALKLAAYNDVWIAASPI